MYPPTQISDTAALARLQERLRRAERRAQQTAGAALDACAFTFLLSLSPALFARSPGISLTEMVACATARENSTLPVVDSPSQEGTGGNRAAGCLE